MLRSLKSIRASRWAVDDTAMAREWKDGAEEARSIGFRSWKRRKCATWLVPNWVWKPSFVRPLGVCRTPALFD